jgi:DNA-binding MarR family transcriptional regulator
MAATATKERPTQQRATQQRATAPSVEDTAARLRFCVARLARLLRQQDHGELGATTGAALATINREGPLTLGELAAREQVAPPSITRAVTKLEQRGFVSRAVDSSDRRVSRVSITPAGAAHLEANRTRRTAWLASRLAGLPTDDVARVAGALDVLEQLSLGTGEGRRS